MPPRRNEWAGSPSATRPSSKDVNRLLLDPLHSLLSLQPLDPRNAGGRLGLAGLLLRRSLRRLGGDLLLRHDGHLPPIRSCPIRARLMVESSSPRSQGACVARHGPSSDVHHPQPCDERHIESSSGSSSGSGRGVHAPQYNASST